MSKLKKEVCPLAKHHFYLKANYGNRNDVGDIKSGWRRLCPFLRKWTDPEKAQILMKCCLERDLLYYNACGDDGKKYWIKKIYIWNLKEL